MFQLFLIVVGGLLVINRRVHCLQCSNVCYPGKCDKETGSCQCPAGLTGFSCTQFNSAVLPVDINWKLTLTFTDGTTQNIFFRPTSIKSNSVFYVNKSPVSNVFVLESLTANKVLKPLLDDRSTDWRLYLFTSNYGTWGSIVDRSCGSGTQSLKNQITCPRSRMGSPKSGFTRYSYFGSTMSFMHKVWLSGYRQKADGSSKTSIAAPVPSLYFTIQIKFVNDQQPPSCSCLLPQCSQPVIVVDSDPEEKGRLKLSTPSSQWTDQSQMQLTFSVYQLKFNTVRQELTEDVKTVFQTGYTLGSLPSLITIKDSGAYSIILNVTDSFGHVTLARQIIVVNVDEPPIVPSKEFPLRVNGRPAFTASAKPVYVNEQRLNVNWQNHYETKLGETYALNQISTRLDIKASLDSRPNRGSGVKLVGARYRDLKAINNDNGVTAYKISVTVPELGTSEQFTSIRDIKEASYEYGKNLVNGQENKIVLVATDFVGNSVEETFYVIGDFVPPKILSNELKLLPPPPERDTEANTQNLPFRKRVATLSIESGTGSSPVDLVQTHLEVSSYKTASSNSTFSDVGDGKVSCIIEIHQCLLADYVEKLKEKSPSQELTVQLSITVKDSAGNSASNSKTLSKDETNGLSHYPAPPVEIKLVERSEKMIKVDVVPFKDCFVDKANPRIILYKMDPESKEKEEMNNKPLIDDDKYYSFVELEPSTKYVVASTARYGKVESEPFMKEVETMESSGPSVVAILLIICLLILIIVVCILVWGAKKRGWFKSAILRARGGGDQQPDVIQTGFNNLANSPHMTDTYGITNDNYTINDEDDLDDLGQIYGDYEPVSSTGGLLVALMQPDDIRLSANPLSVNGKFADFFKGQYCGRTAKINKPIVVKKLKENASPSDKKLMEAKMNFFRDFNPSHVNVIAIVGIVPSQNWIVMEYCEKGVLSSWLKTHNHIDDRSILTDFCVGIAQGMDYLHNAKVTAMKGSVLLHKKLHSKNILLDKNRTPKIIGFGPDKSESTVEEKRPFRWLAPESLDSNSRQYSVYSDTWSFGVLAWEIFAFGALPYKSEGKDTIFEVQDYISTGHRLSQPADCPPKCFTLMMDCWAANPSSRPRFDEIASRLKM